jgi:hypothetical protein
MDIFTIKSNLENTIKNKEAMLAQYREDIDLLTNDRKLIAFEGEIASLNVTARFLDVNIGELQRILADVEVVANKTMNEIYRNG